MYELWTWGANSHGQLSLGNFSEQVDQPTKVVKHSLGKIKQMACGGGHSLLLGTDGKLYSCGWNSKQQLGNEDELNVFQRVWSLSGINFTYVSCGWDFSCGITDDQFLFVWGSNRNGQLGLPRNKFPDEVKPIRLQVIAKLVSMGLRHTAIVNSKGEVWITGSGRHGQLGLGDEVTSSDRFQKVPKIGNITHIACGQNHTVAWSSVENALYVWGDNKHGQLLLSVDKYKKIYTPQKIDIDIKQGVIKLLSGWTNVLMLLEDGKLIGWGRNNYGQLGSENSAVGNKISISLPDERKIKDVAIGSEHTLCLATDNTLWAWGWNEHANTGIRSHDCILIPTMVPVEKYQSTKITQIYSGSAHNFVVIENSTILENKDKDLI